MTKKGAGTRGTLTEVAPGTQAGLVPGISQKANQEVVQTTEAIKGLPIYVYRITHHKMKPILAFYLYFKRTKDPKCS